MNDYRVDFEAIEWTTPGPGVRFKVFRQSSRQLRLVEFSRDFVEADCCMKGHIGYVLEGTGELQLPDRSVRLAAGDGIFIPAGPEYRHKTKVLSDVLRVVLVEDVQ